MKTITAHQVDKVGQGVGVEATGNPTAGGAHNAYRILAHGNPSQPLHASLIFFHDAEHNGVTNETLLAIVLDRLQAFQAGPFPCIENAAAIKDVQSALGWLRTRAELRPERGVSGKCEE